ncbi:hypothetical protein D4Q76_00995 [archaeon]|nr:MAG: hypothetical protein D4Q76_00995 [archaeon]
MRKHTQVSPFLLAQKMKKKSAQSEKKTKKREKGSANSKFRKNFLPTAPNTYLFIVNSYLKGAKLFSVPR